MNEQTYYKVVWHSPGGFLESCVVPSELSVRYIPGVKTRSDHGPLLIFDTLAHARAFLTGRVENGCEIWECVAGNAVPLAFVVLLVGVPGLLSEVAQFWDDSTQSYGKIAAPLGTLAADWVELTRKVS